MPLTKHYQIHIYSKLQAFSVCCTEKCMWDTLFCSFFYFEMHFNCLVLFLYHISTGNIGITIQEHLLFLCYGHRGYQLNGICGIKTASNKRIPCSPHFMLSRAHFMKSHKQMAFSSHPLVCSDQKRPVEHITGNFNVVLILLGFQTPGLSRKKPSLTFYVWFEFRVFFLL